MFSQLSNVISVENITKQTDCICAEHRTVIPTLEKARKKMQKAKLIKLARQHIAEALELIDIAETMEEKRGYWYDKGSMSCRCSNCGCKSTSEYSFCPNCGADMRGKKNGK